MIHKNEGRLSVTLWQIASDGEIENAVLFEKYSNAIEIIQLDNRIVIINECLDEFIKALRQVGRDS
jgi:hypothetical protein